MPTLNLTQVRHDFPICYVIDGVAILNELSPKPTWIKQGVDLAAAFNMSIHTHTQDAIAVIVTFDCYRDISLNQATRTSRKGKRAPRSFHISDNSNIDKVTMPELLSSEETKQSISHYLTKTTELHLQKSQVRYIVSANGKTQFSNGEEISNNHEEADTLIIHTLEQMKPINYNVIVHATDTDVFFFIVETLQGDIMSQPLYFTGAWICQYYSFNE